MSDRRAALIEALNRVIAGEELTNEQLDAAIPDPRSLEGLEFDAWESLSHWADDDDIREKDPAYEPYRREELRRRLADLDALDAGYLTDEVDRGEHQASRMPALVRLLAVMALVMLLYLTFRFLLQST